MGREEKRGSVWGIERDGTGQGKGGQGKKGEGDLQRGEGTLRERYDSEGFDLISDTVNRQRGTRSGITDTPPPPSLPLLLSAFYFTRRAC